MEAAGILILLLLLGATICIIFLFIRDNTVNESTVLEYLCNIYMVDFASLFLFQFFSTALTFIILQGKKGVWIKMPIQLANLVEPAVKVMYSVLFVV